MSRRTRFVVLLACALAVVGAAAPGASAGPTSAVWITGNGVPGAGLPGVPYGTAISFRAVNTTVFAIYDLRSIANIQCPPGGVTITGTTNVGTANPASSTVTLTGVAVTN